MPILSLPHLNPDILDILDLTSFVVQTSPLLRSAGDLPGAISVNNNLGAREQALAELLLCGAAVEASLPLGSPSPLLNQSVASLAEVAHLVVFHALQPVAEAGADETVDGVGEETLAVEEGTHFDAELP
jgi:hypothetical protein